MSGSRHWRNQRLSALALLPLSVWFVIALLSQPDLAHESVSTWLADPWQAALMLLFGWCALWHSAQGVQVVVDDYAVGSMHARVRWISRLLHLTSAAALAWAIVTLATGGAA